MDNSRRDFLKKLGLGGLGVVALSVPVISQAISNPNINTIEDFLQVPVVTYRYKIVNGSSPSDPLIALSQSYFSKQECVWNFFLSKSGWESNPIGALNNLAYMLEQKENLSPVDYIVEQKITMKEFLNQFKTKMEAKIEAMDNGFPNAMFGGYNPNEEFRVLNNEELDFTKIHFKNLVS